MPRPGAPIVVVCVAIAAFAALLPGTPGLDYAIFSPSWVLLPDSFVRIVRSCVERCDDQLLALRSPVPSRAPPAA